MTPNITTLRITIRNQLNFIINMLSIVRLGDDILNYILWLRTILTTDIWQTDFSQQTLSQLAFLVINIWWTTIFGQKTFNDEQPYLVINV
jgi:hypothetical protein